MIKSKGNFAFAALLFSAISGISEGLVSGIGSGTVQSSLGTVMFQDYVCADMSACALGTGAVCEACLQEQFVHPQMFSYFKELGHLVQELCESHIPEGNAEGLEEESGKEEEEGREMAQSVKEIKEIMAKQTESIKELKQDIAGMKEPVLQQSQLTALAIKELTQEVRDLQANCQGTSRKMGCVHRRGRQRQEESTRSTLKSRKG